MYVFASAVLLNIRNTCYRVCCPCCFSVQHGHLYTARTEAIKFVVFVAQQAHPLGFDHVMNSFELTKMARWLLQLTHAVSLSAWPTLVGILFVC